jgi:hypothetical protein
VRRRGCGAGLLRVSQRGVWQQAAGAAVRRSWGAVGGEGSKAVGEIFKGGRGEVPASAAAAAGLLEQLLQLSCPFGAAPAAVAAHAQHTAIGRRRVRARGRGGRRWGRLSGDCNIVGALLSGGHGTYALDGLDRAPDRRYVLRPRDKRHAAGDSHQSALSYPVP